MYDYIQVSMEKQKKESKETGMKETKKETKKAASAFSYDAIKKDEEINLLIERGNQVLGELGFTEHSIKHAIKVAQ